MRVLALAAAATAAAAAAPRPCGASTATVTMVTASVYTAVLPACSDAPLQTQQPFSVSGECWNGALGSWKMSCSSSGVVSGET